MKKQQMGIHSRDLKTFTAFLPLFDISFAIGMDRQPATTATIDYRVTTNLVDIVIVDYGIAASVQIIEHLDHFKWCAGR